MLSSLFVLVKMVKFLQYCLSTANPSSLKYLSVQNYSEQYICMCAAI